MIESRLVVTKKTALARTAWWPRSTRSGRAWARAILERGGNAVDAAVATAFAMTVVEPFMSTIAGSGTMLVHMARRGETIALDFNGCAPMRAHASMFRTTTGISRGLFAWPNVEGAANERGWLAPAVPGSVAGLSLALERYGTLALRDAIQPAIELARGGFITDWYQALTTARQIEELAAAGEAGRVYLRNSRALYRPPTGMEEGDRATYPDLARSLELIARDGPNAFYRGEIAQTIHDAMAANGGLITREDLAAYSVRVGAPLVGTVPRRRARVLAGGDRRHHRAGDSQHPRAVPEDRRRLEHPGWTQCPARRPSAARSPIASSISAIQPWCRPRGIGSRRRRTRARSPPRSGVRASEGAGADAIDALGASAAGGDCTTHISVIDRQRNMVALTHTAVSLFGSMVVVPGTGILLNNGMIWFNPEAGQPNSVAPGKRALVNMVPVLGFKKGKPYFTIGSARAGGGSCRRFPRSSPRSSTAAATSRTRSRRPACTRRAVKRSSTFASGTRC